MSTIFEILNIFNNSGISTVISTVIGIYIIYVVYSFIARKIVLQQIKNNFEEKEAILFEPKSTLFFELFLPIGAITLWTKLILPVFVYKTIEVDNLNRAVFALAAVCSLIFVLFKGCFKVVVTNKKIISQFPFTSQKRLKSLYERHYCLFYYSDMTSVQLYKRAILGRIPNQIIVSFKDGTSRWIYFDVYLKDLEKIKSIIENHINYYNKQEREYENT
jgi:hypothetical protein